MLFVLVTIAVASFVIGSLPMANWMVYTLTLNGKLYDVRYRALVRVLTDISKGAIAVAIGHEGGMDGAHLAVLFVYLGHIYPLRGSFGKQNGTGTVLGALVLLHPLVGLTALSAWLFAYYIYRHPGFSAVVSAGLTTLIFGAISNSTQIRPELLVVVMLIIFWRHRHYVFVRG